MAEREDSTMKRIRFGVIWVMLVVVTLMGGASAIAGNGSPPFTRTEQREACLNYQPLRQPFFGELHLHTQYSTDAATLDTRNTPRDAYLFAKGAKVGLPPFINSLAGSEPPPSPPSPPPVSSHPYCFPGEQCQFMATRTIQLPPGRALDFAAITDHSEFFGEGNICFYEEKVACPPNSCGPGQVCSPLEGRCVPVGYDSAECILARQAIAGLRGGLGLELFSLYVNDENPRRFPFCGPNGQNCLFQAGNIWQQIQADAQEAYDQTSACTFTSFIGYEYTAQPSMGQCSTGNGGGSHAPCWETADCHTAGETCQTLPGGDNLHRNIIFRNANVPPLPVSTIEAPPGCGVGASCDNSAARGPLASPKLLLETLTSQCVDNGTTSRCQFLSIPHNPNLSGGAMFLMPESLDEAQLRHDKEPLVELMQIKGQSECRFSPKHPGAWNTADELCDFENLSFGRLGGEFIPDPDATTVLPNSYVRNTLKNGLQFQQKTGINPFQLGFVGGLDNHNGTPGASDGEQYAKTGAHGDLSYAVSGQILNQTFLLGLETNGGGLTGVWAEENSRDSLFAALQRRETFATSGTRPVLRLFGGFALPGDMCKQGNFAQKGYDNGVPMGGTLPGGPTSNAPTFAVLATMDPGWPGHHGTKLQQAQIIKGWVDANGQTHEQVYTVAGQPNNGASVDLRTCKPQGGGSEDLCALWTDPDFDPGEHAFYYARVLENPSCRWNQFYCNAKNIDCNKPLGTCSTGGGCNSDADCHQDEQCNPPASYTEFEYQQCCNSPVPKTVQQRAWTSPIWYTPQQ
jgi:hypothetical protein